MVKRALRRAIERLEDRQLMAGDVSFDNGVLTIQMDSSSSSELYVSSVGSYVKITGNAQFSPSSGDFLRADQVREIKVQGSNRADKISLSNVNSQNYPALQQTEIRGGQGNDTIFGSRVNDIIFGGAGHDTVHGLEGSDVIRGGKGNDNLYGGAGADMIFGGAGNDYLWGAAYHADDTDRDIVVGGRGYDTYGLSNANAGLQDTVRGVEYDRRR